MLYKYSKDIMVLLMLTVTCQPGFADQNTGQNTDQPDNSTTPATEPATNQAKPQTSPESQQTLKLEYTEQPLIRFVDATIEAEHQATVSAQVSGRVIALPFDVDDYVKKGDVIARFRDKEQQATLKAAQANVDEAQLAFNRASDIYKKKLIAKADLDRATARLKTMKATLEQAKEAMQNTVVRAPYSGIVVKRHVELGELARVGQKLLTGLSLEKLRATAQVPQSMIHALRANQQAWVYTGKDLQQKVSAEKLTISPYADAVSHTFTVRVYLPEGDHQIYPGMHTRVGFQVATEKLLTVPSSAIVYRSEVTAVYVMQEKQIMLRQIRAGRLLDNNHVEVLSGLTAGEEVILDPAYAMSQLHSVNK